MLRFLGKIRKSLIESGGAGKPVLRGVERYLFYALGEIGLVVIGILIALQINNWNEWRNDRIKEKYLSIQLHEEFIRNKALLASTVDSNRMILQNLSYLISLFPIQPDRIDQQTLINCQFALQKAGVAYTFNPSNVIVNALTNQNSFDILTDDSLRMEVLNWNSVLEDYIEDETRNVKHSLEQLQPYLDAKGISSSLGLLDKRVDISFLSTLEFEAIIRRKHNRLTRMYGLSNDAFYLDLGNLHNSIEKIVRLTRPD